jgi:hypothetical protein
VPWLGLRIGIPRIGEKAAATVRAAVLSGLSKSSKCLGPTTAQYLRGQSKHLWDIAAHYLRKQRQHLWALAACRLDKMPNGQRVLVAAMAVASVLGGFVTTSALLQRSTTAAVSAAPPLAPTPAKVTWVSDYEIDRAQQVGRILLSVSPAELLSLYERQGSAALEGYRERWVKIDYPIVSFAKQTFGKTTYDMVEAAAHFQSTFPGKIIAVFGDRKWGARLLMHRPGDQIVAFCQFKEIDSQVVLTNIQQLWFYGTDCDLPTY